MNQDITSIKDVKHLVNEFYGKVREDELLSPIFNGAIQDNWSIHLEKMYRFWQTVLFHEKAYSGSPFPHHVKLPIEAHHFERWLQLFEKTLAENFNGEVADMALYRANKMAEMFQYKLSYLKNNHN